MVYNACSLTVIFHTLTIHHRGHQAGMVRCGQVSSERKCLLDTCVSRSLDTILVNTFYYVIIGQI